MNKSKRIRAKSKLKELTMPTMKTFGDDFIVAGQMSPTFATSINPRTVQIYHCVIFLSCVLTQFFTDCPSCALLLCFQKQYPLLFFFNFANATAVVPAVSHCCGIVLVAMATSPFHHWRYRWTRESIIDFIT